MKKTTLILGTAGLVMALACGGADDEAAEPTTVTPVVEEAEAPTEEAEAPAEEATEAAEAPAEEAAEEAEAAEAPAEEAAEEEPPARERKVKKGTKTKGR